MNKVIHLLEKDQKISLMIFFLGIKINYPDNSNINKSERANNDHKKKFEGSTLGEKLNKDALESELSRKRRSSHSSVNKFDMNNNFVPKIRNTIVNNQENVHSDFLNRFKNVIRLIN